PKWRAMNDSSDVDLGAGCRVLGAWDRADSPHSRGAVLFREFWSRAAKITHLFAVSFDPEAPLQSPRELNTQDIRVARELREALIEAMQFLASRGVSIDAPLGELQYVVRGDERIAIPGGSGDA